MGTRAMVCVEDPNGGYVAYYKHLDGYPRALGWELYKFLSSNPEDAMDALLSRPPKKLGLEHERHVDRFETVFDLQSDLEWIYVVENFPSPHKDLIKITVYRTSFPWFRKKFITPVCSVFTHYEAQEANQMLRFAEMATDIAVNILYRLLES